MIASAFDHFVNNLTLYDLTSGWIPCLALVIGVPSLLLKHNCYEHRCPRIGRLKGDDGHVRCKRHHRPLHPDYGT